MEIAVYVNLLAIACSAMAFPAEIPFDYPEEIDLTKLVSKKVYVEPINPVNTADLPGSRIIGGTELAPHAAPYQAALLVNANMLCSGALITTTKILTTATCVWNAAWVAVYLGAHRFKEEETTQVRITSRGVIIHKSFDDDGYKANDIGIAVLPAQIPLNDFIKVVGLPDASASTYEGTWGLVSGWGTTSEATDLPAPALRGAYVNIMSNLDCRNIYGAAVVLDSKLCTSGAGIVGICDGDSGSPLVANGLLVGIAAFSGQCEQGLPTGYTRISSFRSWIESYAGV